MKRFLACLLALIMALPMTACAAEATDFTDVPADADYAQAVAWCKEQGLMKGTSDTQFSPEDTLTRAMVVTVLYRRAGQPGLADENLGYPFADVDASAWYGMAVYWARLQGIVQGYGDGRFGTEDPITREQLAAILYRYAEYAQRDTSARGDLSGYTDGAQVSSWARDAVEWAAGTGLLTGKGAGVLDPGGTATRAEVATMLMRFVTAADK